MIKQYEATESDVFRDLFTESLPSNISRLKNRPSSYLLMEEQGDEKATGRLYECDPAKNLACNKSMCHINGGECYRTTKKEYAKE